MGEAAGQRKGPLKKKGGKGVGFNGKNVFRAMASRTYFGRGGAEKNEEKTGV